MSTYTVQQHRHSGDTITGISEALSWRDVDAMIADDLPGLTYTPYRGNPDGTGDDGSGAGFVLWHPPVITTE